MANPQEVLSRAAQARALLEDEFLQIIIDEMEGEAIALWKNTGALQQAERERYYMMLKAIQLFRSRLMDSVTAGRVEELKFKDNDPLSFEVV